MLSVLEGILVHAVSHLQDTMKERDSLEQALRRSHLPSNTFILSSLTVSVWIMLRFFFFFFCIRRESEHDQVVRSIYEEMESQIREEREKLLVQV